MVPTPGDRVEESHQNTTTNRQRPFQRCHLISKKNRPISRQVKTTGPPAPGFRPPPVGAHQLHMEARVRPGELQQVSAGILPSNTLQPIPHLAGSLSTWGNPWEKEQFAANCRMSKLGASAGHATQTPGWPWGLGVAQPSKKTPELDPEPSTRRHSVPPVEGGEGGSH